MDVFMDAVKKIERLGPDIMDAVCLRPWIERFHDIPKEERLPYYKIPILGRGGKEVVMIFWVPNLATGVRNGTKPHSHNGSEARVRVLLGMLRQDVFSIDIDEAGRRRINSVERCYTGHASQSKDRGFVEKPHSIHALSNQGLGDWAVSLHEFDEDFSMEIYDFNRNLRWPVTGHEDTLGDPPEDAIPIWPRDE